ncbi:hypothetical protein CEXT_704101 [Caerostris extrusa]|uniref:Uncharacterized protein n=1 Tax=Caerostris extrusa TaxID=172846 RepID=A0AAV4W236_CAEEX|nr:hypothetical protein CEXT_704101 [Caerostris extrusa]
MDILNNPNEGFQEPTIQEAIDKKLNEPLLHGLEVVENMKSLGNCIVTNCPYYPSSNKRTHIEEIPFENP